VALKVFQPSMSAAGRYRFEAEARALSRLEHPGICSVYEVGEHRGQPFIAMQHVDGETLIAASRRARREDPSSATHIDRRRLEA